MGSKSNLDVSVDVRVLLLVKRLYVLEGWRVCGYGFHCSGKFVNNRIFSFFAAENSVQTVTHFNHVNNFVAIK